MDKEKITEDFEKELNNQGIALWNRIKSFFAKMDRVELTLFTMFSLCMITGLALFGLAGAEVMKNKDCYSVPFNLTSINENIDPDLGEYGYENIIILDDYTFIANGVSNNTNLSYEVVQEGMDIEQLREMFPNGEYYLNMCPETNEYGETEYVLRGLLNVNTINKFFFGRN